MVTKLLTLSSLKTRNAPMNTGCIDRLATIITTRLASSSVGLRRKFVATSRKLEENSYAGEVITNGHAQQIVGPEPREASFASSVIRLSCSVAPWPGQLHRYVLTPSNEKTFPFGCLPFVRAPYFRRREGLARTGSASLNPSRRGKTSRATPASPKRWSSAIHIERQSLHLRCRRGRRVYCLRSTKLPGRSNVSEECS